MIEIAVEKPNSTYSDLMKEFSGRTQQLLLPKFKKAKDEVLTKRRIDRIKELEEENEGLMQEDKDEGLELTLSGGNCSKEEVLLNCAYSISLFTTITIHEAAHSVKAILSFRVPEQRFGKEEIQYLHDYTGISTSVGLTANPIVKLSSVIGNNVTALRGDLSYDSKTGEVTKFNAGLTVTKDDLVASLIL
ncbi:Voltage-dependent anion-selective channel protein 1 [Trifolium repens]|nr:Voltage-dependent anion-selective channel protein 1 [Trifolium repens]